MFAIDFHSTVNLFKLNDKENCVSQSIDKCLKFVRSENPNTFNVYTYKYLLFFTLDFFFKLKEKKTIRVSEINLIKISFQQN